jgi:glutathione S-transferase
MRQPAPHSTGPEISMHYALALPALVTLLALAFYVFTGVKVGIARGRYKIAAPAVTGDPAFERAYRVQMNTLEQIVAFLPALWLYATFGNPFIASGLGLLWIVGRIWYAAGYYRAASKREAGFVLTFVAFAALWTGATYGVLRLLFV